LNKEEETKISNSELQKQPDDAIRSIGGHQLKVAVFRLFKAQDSPDTNARVCGTKIDTNGGSFLRHVCGFLLKV
jgi:hypothetical protein